MDQHMRNLLAAHHYEMERRASERIFGSYEFTAKVSKKGYVTIRIVMPTASGKRKFFDLHFCDVTPEAGRDFEIFSLLFKFQMRSVLRGGVIN